MSDLIEAPGHFDGDGCTFPAIGHLVYRPGHLIEAQHGEKRGPWNRKGPGFDTTAEAYAWLAEQARQSLETDS